MAERPNEEVKVPKVYFNYEERQVCTQNGIWVEVEGFKDGIVTMRPPAGIDIVDFCQVIAACVDPESGFEEKLMASYTEEKVLKAFNGITFCFNTRKVYVPKGKMSAKDIFDKWKKTMPTKS